MHSHTRTLVSIAAGFPDAVYVHLNPENLLCTHIKWRSVRAVCTALAKELKNITTFTHVAISMQRRCDHGHWTGERQHGKLAAGQCCMADEEGSEPSSVHA